MTRISASLFLALAFSVFAGCGTPSSKPEGASPPPLFEGLGSHHRAVTTSSSQAQRYFDQALIFTYSFNHDEAIRSYTEAARLDPECAMAWWGIALCNGPHINNPAMDEKHSQAAWDALQKAQGLAARANPTEQALITALSARYASPPPQDRSSLDHAYAAAMKSVHAQFSEDPDVGALYAESLMDLRPWDLWSLDGQARPETPEVLAALEKVMTLQPSHPGANHLYIHAVEASPQPQRALPAADRLRTLVPAAGHMVHMPAHIDVRVGNWPQAANQNQQAIVADGKYRAISPRQGFYSIYMAHNHQFLSWACMMEGRARDAIKAARDMVSGVPPEFLEHNAAAVDGIMSIAMDALMRFGKWDDLLREPAPPANLPITTAFWRFSRAIASSAKGDVTGAEREQADFAKAVAAVPETARMAQNPAHTALSIADHMLKGELAFRRGNIDDAVGELKQAVAIEDTLRYMEPPDWMQPVRHTLGAVLVSAGRTEEAEKVYRDDLKRWPENGWALYGLAQCLKKLNLPEAASVEARFQKAWQRADTKIATSCLCVSRKD